MIRYSNNFWFWILQSFLYKCLGIVLRKAGTSDFIREHLNLIFSSVDHTSQIEREGCAIGIGFCAASHLDKCLVKLEEITKTEMIRKSTGFMGLTKVLLFEFICFSFVRIKERAASLCYLYQKRFYWIVLVWKFYFMHCCFNCFTWINFYFERISLAVRDYVLAIFSIYLYTSLL